MNSSKLTLRTKLLAMFFTALTFNPFSVQPILADVHDVMQKAVVTGTVVDDQGEPIIGATVTVVGGNASQGAISDMDGNFSIQVSPRCQAQVFLPWYVRRGRSCQKRHEGYVACLRCRTTRWCRSSGLWRSEEGDSHRCPTHR